MSGIYPIHNGVTGWSIDKAGADRDGEVRKVCSTKIPDLVEAMCYLGCDYSTMVSMFREAQRDGRLNTRLVVNAVPRIGNQRKTQGMDQPPLDKSDKYVAGPLPELFRAGDDAAKPIEEATMAADKGPKGTKNSDSTETRLSKIKGWLSRDRED